MCSEIIIFENSDPVGLGDPSKYMIHYFIQGWRNWTPPNFPRGTLSIYKFCIRGKLLRVVRDIASCLGATVGNMTISALGYADDIILISDPPETEQKLIIICETWTKLIICHSI